MGCDYCQSYQAYRAAYDTYVATVTGRGQNGQANQITYNLAPLVLSNGGIQYTDRNGHGYMKSFRYANGEYAYFGTENVIQRLLGRSELDRVGPKMKDGMFSND